MTTNPDCDNCTRREAIGPCPCGCKRWLCRRCLKSTARNLAVIAQLKEHTHG